MEQAAKILELRHISKSFGAVKALKSMNLEVYAGRVHTLLGENGAGKSTLMKILAGIYPQDSGEIYLSGKRYQPSSPQEAIKQGVAIVFQELSLVNNLTVAQNIYANNEQSKFMFINDRKLEQRANELLAELGFAIRADQLVGNLSIAQRQLVEIAKGLSREAKLIILDEPTSSLSDSEAEQLFSIIKRLTAQGKAVVYISHRMEEIMRLSDDITVMRDGEYIQTVKKSTTSIEQLITLMVGREMAQIYPEKLPYTVQPLFEPILSVENLNVSNKVKNVSFSVKCGEILGFFGLVDAGRSDVMKALFGILPYEGEVKLRGQVVKINNPRVAIKYGIAFLTENRKEQGVSLFHSLRTNITMAALPKFNRKGWLAFGAELQAAQLNIDKLAIKTHSSETVVATLSGGNQQKVVLAKWLETTPDILILDEPTRGVDVAAKYEIYCLIRQLAANGTAILLVSSELPEVLGLADRIAIMADKSIRSILAKNQLNAEKIMAIATGQGELHETDHH